MAKKNGYPVAARQAIVNIGWNAIDADTLDFLNAHITFQNEVYVPGLRGSPQSPTSMAFQMEEPIEWPESFPPEIEATVGKPVDALRMILGLVYESPEHLYRLAADGYETRPVEE